MTPRPPRRRPSPRAARRALGAVLALLVTGAATGCDVPGAVPGAAPPGSAGQSPFPASSLTSASTWTPATGRSAPSPSADRPEGSAALVDVLGLPDLTPLLVPLPEPEVLDPALDEALELRDGAMSAAVLDALTGEVLYDRDAGDPAVPASAVKILTAIAALEVLGPDHRYTTTAVALPGHVGDEAVTHVVLDAGGDVLLGAAGNGKEASGRAGLGTLARRAAERLAEEGTTGTVTVRVDDTGYTGPDASPDWSRDIVTSGNASAVQPIATYGGRARPSTGTDRLHDPALYAAEVFRDRLAVHARKAGADVEVGDEVARLDLAGRGTELAGVESATVEEQVRHMLKTSDNQVAEATGRNLALAAGGKGSFAGAAAAIERSVAGLGVDTEGLELVDASGLSGDNRVSALQLAQALQAAATDPRLETAATGLPVAGREGTLEERMVGSPAEGVVRAKTGTLSEVASLTGTVETEDGRRLLFSFIANDQPGVLTDARLAVDRAAVVLAECGCRKGG